jgi:CRISPR-associated Csx3 family protein
MKTEKMMVEIVIASGVMAPEETQRLGELFAQALGTAPEGAVIISGRMPVWAFAHLAVRAALTGRPVATFDPRLQAGVIVWPASSAGQLLPVTGEETRREIVI